jgi:hypothetical protein
MTVLQTNKGISGFLNHMSSKAKKVNFNKQVKYLENGMECDDFVELLNFSHELCDLYSI